MDELEMFRASVALIEAKNKKIGTIQDEETLTSIYQFPTPLRFWVATWMAVVERNQPKHGITYLEILKGDTGQLSIDELKREALQHKPKIKRMINWHKKRRR